MILAGRIDFAALMEPVALKLLGEPNMKLSNLPRDVRFGSRGSLAVNFEDGKWFDHEAKVGGGVLDLISHKTGRNRAEAQAWLRREGICSLASSSPPALRTTTGVRTHGKIVATYDYIDERGDLIFQVVRFDPKDFRQRRPARPDDDPAKSHRGWVWEVRGARQVLYQLPDLINAVAAGRHIFIVEGEKDADNLRTLGFAATTNPGGVGKWRQDFCDFLKEANVVIAADNDDPGRTHGERIAASLNGIAKRIRILDIGALWPDCPPKGDVSDWIASGGDEPKEIAIKLREMVGQLSDWNPAEEVRDEPSSGAEREKASAAIGPSNNPGPDNANVFKEQTWPVLDGAAFHGVTGDVVNTIAPHSETDKVALLIQFLVAAGNVIGRTAYYQVEADQHHSRLFAVLVGASAKARKGTSLGHIKRAIRVVDQTWSEDRIKGGLSSGEGLINEVRDAVTKWDSKAQTTETVDPGVTDKRLMVVEPEFAGALAAAERHGNTLSQLVRRAWDGDKLSTLTRNSPLTATGAHISLIGHITDDELRARLNRTEMANGFANRFLFAMVRRSKELPFGGGLTDSEILHMGEQLRGAVEKGRMIGRVSMTDSAREIWASVYSDLSAGKPGLLGAITARAEAQTVRLALTYALLDGVDAIDEPHITAALALWEYCEQSAKYIFGNTLGDPVADDIERALQQAGTTGMTRTGIRDMFGRNKSGERIAAALALLVTRGRARTEPTTTGGRSAETYFATREG
jgi:hypothetical protein